MSTWWRDQRGAVAPIVGLSLFGLVAIGGIAFDYARMAAMDTELQNAADQAALAAATQLDGGTDSCSRASAAAVSFVSNITMFANDGGNRAVTVTSEPTCDATGSIRFYEDEAKSTPALIAALAKFVEVTVNGRTANFALTPVVAAFTSGALRATAFAGMGSSICGVEPMMICNPDEPAGNADPEYPFVIGSRVGIGIELVDDEQDVPGNFGFLETGLGGASGLLQVLAYDNSPANCLPVGGVETKPGFNASVMDGLNTRFDIVSSNDCPGGGPCSSSMNSRKDLVRGNACNWNEPSASEAEQGVLTNPPPGYTLPPNPPRYRPTSNDPLDPSITPVIMGHPRDICHAWGESADCGLGNRLGNGVWDRAAYFRSNHPGLDWVNESGLGATVTRYETYLWELENIPNRLDPKDTLNTPTRTAHGTPEGNKCHAPGLMPSPAGDRRVISAAVLNCKAIGVHGRTTGAPVITWLDLFLVEPAINRFRCDDNSDASQCKNKYSDKREVYVELVGERPIPDFGTQTPTVFRRDVPYLIE